MAESTKSLAILACCAILTVALAACGSEEDGDESSTAARTNTPSLPEPAQTNTSSLPRPSGKQIEASTMARPSAAPPVYFMKEYDAETTWENVAGDRRVGHRLESDWRDPASTTSHLLIASRPSAGAPSPLPAAELARMQVSRQSDYRPRSLDKVKLGNRPAVRLTYDAGGESHIAYFFERCGTSIVVRGSSSLATTEMFFEYYELAASRIKVLCDSRG